MSFYPKVTTDPTGSTPASPRFPEIEKRVLEYWKNDGTFQASIDQREGEEFVFYDGPPFANGLPHYGHLLTGYVKDLVARYQTQRGKRVERRFGWDTHGLPAELEAMKQLGMTDKQQIESMGIDKFNDACRTSVMKYADEWKQYVNRQARWVDFENDYKTLNVEFMESVIWAFKQLSDKGLTYQGFRVLPYCWKDETPLSNHELRMDDDVYKNRQDQTVTVGFTILAGETEASKALAGVQALAWTTTPWTLPTNAALAVHPKIEYVVVPAGEAGVKASAAAGPFLLAKDLLGSYAKDLGYKDAKEAASAITANFQGSELAGVRYEPLWDTFTDTEKYGNENAWQIVTADYVTVGDGTGIVHQAPAYGEDDQQVCEAHGIPVVLSIDEGAKFLPLFAGGPLNDIAGVQVFDANKTITNVLKDDARLVKQASYEHSYPHCWRCRTPLIYRAISSWYVEVTKIKDRMVELNEQINWIPGNVKHGQFGKWLENARDWSISRNRYWGSPIPVWECSGVECTHREVFGSLEEINNFFGRLPLNHEGQPDLHRPFIDELTKAHEGCAEGGTLSRVEDVLDVWFDSGSMPYAQVHYPFENGQWFDSGHHPADFIVEYIGQTRGWFYTMHVLSTALFDRPAYTNVISHGIVLGSDGQKMSKSLQNYPNVNEVLDRDGSDAMRWFLMASPILRGGNLVVTEQGIRDGVRQVLLPLWNVWHFFNLYTNSANNGAGYEAKRSTSSTDPLDQYMLAATGELVREVTEALDTYEVSDATEAVRHYMDTLTNWYVRRSRQRFFDEDTQAFDTLYTALETLVKVSASLLPLASEEIFRGLTGERSVHLTDWPDANDFPADTVLLETMDTTRKICSVGSSLRKAKNLRVRLPLAELKVVLTDAARLDDTFLAIIREELNLKQVTPVEFSTERAAEFGVGMSIKLNFRELGKSFGKLVPQIKKAVDRGGDLVASDIGLSLVLETGEKILVPPHLYELQSSLGGTVGRWEVASVSSDIFIALDTEVTKELEAEGFVRDLVRSIQRVRKEQDLKITDRIGVHVKGLDEDRITTVNRFENLIKSATLSLNLSASAAPVLITDTKFEEINGESYGIEINKVERTV